MEIEHMTRLQAEIGYRHDRLEAEADQHQLVAAAAPASRLPVDRPLHALRVRLGAAFVAAGESLLDPVDEPCPPVTASQTT